MQHGRLETAEGEVEALAQHRTGELEAGPAVRGGPFDGRSARVAQTEHGRHLVECFTRSVVARLSQYQVAAPFRHVQQQGVTARDDERHERGREVGMVQRRCEDVALEMMDPDQREVVDQRQALGVAHTHEQRAHQSRSHGHGQGVHPFQ